MATGNLDRRNFGKVLFAGAASAGLAAAGTVAAQTAAQTAAPASVIPGLKVIRNDKIRLGGQRGFGTGPVTSKENMNWHLRWGIKHLDVSLEGVEDTTMLAAIRLLRDGREVTPASSIHSQTHETYL